jgi:hypothetical protein
LGYIVRSHFPMAYFHVTAVFETRGASQEEADRAAVAVFTSMRHPRVHFYEHDTNGGIGPFPPGKSLYFTTIAEFDVEASREEQAGEVAEEILDSLSTESAQYLGLGVVPGSQRVSPEQRRAREEELPEESEARTEQEESEDHEGKGRRPRGRRRKRGPERETRPEASLIEKRHHEEGTPVPVRILPPARPAGVEVVALEPPVAPVPVVRSPREEQPQTVSISELIVDTPPPPPPPRSSASMRVTLTVNLRVSELSRLGEGTMDRSELIALASEEARRRHPELPADVVPESATSPLPAGDTLLMLTWHFDRPIPSASESAE